ncbi:3-dehydroquinate synthase [Candidatus Peregrinibacteria bacterium]|nr:3-dehydroquinate synthase [Candidatus Peregrinibacteria bacterium]
MQIIKTKLKKKVDNSYKIFIGEGLAKDLAALLKESPIGKKYAIITDSITKKLFGKNILKNFNNKKISAEIFTFNKGEKSKQINTIEKLANEMIAKGFDRKDAIIALGGGVVGDLAGFLASIYMRGIPYIQVPTTLLAMVDSAIGGKTGVDIESGKNLLGTIAQPKAVYIDIDFLKTLPKNQIQNGLAEIIKYAVICDKRFFKYLEKNLEKILNLDKEAILYIIEKSVKIKTKVVEKDETENLTRMKLNYGHTYGHALEKQSNYTLLHGFAVAIGMVLANEIAVKEGYLKSKTAERIRALIKRAGLPTTTIKKPEIKYLSSDKKCYGGQIHFVLPKRIGKVKIHKVKCR